MGKRVAVLMGGWGEEREVSLKTGEAVVAALEHGGHAVTRVFAGPGLDRALRAAEPEVAFLALHGRMGEDGRVQGLLEVLGVPYTGSGVLASALAMNKPMAKRLFTLHGVPTPQGYATPLVEERALLARHGDLGFPCVVKPACGGSSVGLTLVHEARALAEAVERAARYGGEALVERQVVGREVTVGILDGEVLGTMEIEAGPAGFDFVQKYRAPARHVYPPRLSEARRSGVEALALTAYRALGCRGYGRVDVLCGEQDNDVVLEVNTLPGLTPVSLLPELARHAGLSFAELVERVLALATLDPCEPRPQRPAAAPAAHPVRAAG